MLIFHAKHRPATLLNQLQVVTSSVTSSASTKSFGVVLDSTLSLDKQVTQICKTMFVLFYWEYFTHRKVFESPDRDDPCPCICYLNA